MMTETEPTNPTENDNSNTKTNRENVTSSNLESVSPEDFGQYSELFDGDRLLRLIILTTLENQKGEMWKITFSPAKDDFALVLVTDLFSATAGNAEHDKEAYAEFFSKTKRHTLLLFPDQAWIDLGKSHFGFGFVARKNMRFSFDESNLSLDYLQSLKVTYQKKYDYSEYEIREIGTQDEKNLSNYLMEHFEMFYDRLSLVHNDLIWVAVHKESRVVAAIAGAAHPIVDNHFEIQIVTEPDHRKKGLSMIITIEHLLEAMDRGYSPHWDAASSLSASIAEKLGYGDRVPYTVYFWTSTMIQILRLSRIPKIVVWFLRKVGKIKS